MGKAEISPKWPFAFTPLLGKPRSILSTRVRAWDPRWPLRTSETSQRRKSAKDVTPKWGCRLVKTRVPPRRVMEVWVTQGTCDYNPTTNQGRKKSILTKLLTIGTMMIPRCGVGFHNFPVWIFNIYNL